MASKFRVIFRLEPNKSFLKFAILITFDSEIIKIGKSIIDDFY